MDLVHTFAPLFLIIALLFSPNFAAFSAVLPFDKFRRCQPAQNWLLNGRPLVNDYRGRVLLLVFMSSEREVKQCERELHRLDTLSEHFTDVRVMAVAPREERTSKVRALAWQFPRIRFESETDEAPVWRWFGAFHLDKAIFDRCSRFTGWVPSSADFTITLTALQTTLSGSPCGHCDFDLGQKQIHWPSFHPPVPQQQKKADVFVNIDGSFIEPFSSLRRWNSPSSAAHAEYRPQPRGDTKAQKRRLHWKVDTVEQQQQRNREATIEKPQKGRPTAFGTPMPQKQSTQKPQQQQQNQYLYGQQIGGHLQQRGEQQTAERWTHQRIHGQHATLVDNESQRQSGGGGGETVPSSHGGRVTVGTGKRTEERLSSLNDQRGQRWKAVEQQRTNQHVAVPKTTSTVPVEPAPLYPEGSEDAAGDNYYEDEYAAEWTTEAPEAAKQIPKPTRPAMPTPSATTQVDKNFGFELPCTGFSDESCFQQQTQLRPNEMHRCCRGRILFTDQCAVGKCSNATVQLCCIQRFLQAKLTCCSDERQADTEVGDHFSRCCFEHFVDGEDSCCPRAYAAEQWRSVHELCLPNVELDLTGVKVPSPLVGTTLITEFDFSKTDRWRFECRYGSHVQQYSFFEASASSENEQHQEDEEDE